MDAARAAVNKFTGNRGHQTTVEENVRPAVVHEAVKPQRHEEATQAVDREVHQDHYHTTVQPLQHQEVLPEKHQHQMLPTEHREFHHEDKESTKQRLEQDLGKFKDSSVTHETRHTQSAAPTVTGEHVHHHVHETVVPVVHKETIQPEVVHTTKPVHETHHAASQHHGMSALPMKSLDEFKKAGGALTGGDRSTHEQYEGAPRPYNENLSTTFEKLEEKFPDHHGSHTHGTHTGQTGTGLTSGSTGLGHSNQTGTTGLGHSDRSGMQTGTTGGLMDSSKGHRPTDSGVAGLGNERGLGHESGLGHERNDTGHQSGNALGGMHDNTYNSGSTGHHDGLSGKDRVGQLGTTESNETTHKKPSLLDRLNPKKDADGDGKPGFMK